MVFLNRILGSAGKASPVTIFIIAAMVLWLLYQSWEPKITDPSAVSRVVEARGSLAEDEKTTIDIFRNAAPSVVYITSITVRRNLFSLNVQEIPQGTGSGFIWDNEGRVVTNFHVISDANKIAVTLSDQSTWKAALVGAAPDYDLAVLQISAPLDQLIPIPVGRSDDLLVGQKVFAIGNPFGLDHTLTTGVVSALGRQITAITGRNINDVIQTDAAINPGNSGGPLLDSAGRIIGINTMIYSPSGANSGIGFAVPVDIINRIVPQLIRKGKVIRPGLGISTASSRITQQFVEAGVLIMGVQKGSAAESAGLRPTRQMRDGVILGDIILAVNNQSVADYNDLRDIIEKYDVGSMVTLTILRDDQQMNVDVRLEPLE
ncbi:MAG: trypsin-like peptidase domain-containing protein [Desulfobulbaceae bacterium]|nr:trypsin-like peptidase domain-containing protein [Desulfobulbaceae bacterium]